MLEASQGESKARGGNVTRWKAFADTRTKDFNNGRALNEMKARVAHGEQENQELQQDVSRLQAESQSVHKAKAGVGKQLADTQSLVTTLSDRAEQQKARNEKLELDNKEQERIASAAKLSEARLRDEFEECKSANVLLQQAKDKLVPELIKAERSAGKLKKDFESERESKEWLKARNLELQGLRVQLEQSIEDTSATVGRLLTKLQLAEGKTATLTGDRNDVKQQLDAAMTKSTKLLTEAKAFEAAAALSLSEKSVMEVQLAAATTALKKLRDDLDGINAESDRANANWTARIDEQSKSTNKLRTHYKQCLRDNEDLHVINRSDAEKLAAEQTLTNDLRTELSCYVEQVQQLHQTIERLEVDLQHEKRAAEAATVLLTEQRAGIMAVMAVSSRTFPADQPVTIQNDQVTIGAIDTSHRSAPLTPVLDNSGLPSPITPSMERGRPARASLVRSLRNTIAIDVESSSTPGAARSTGADRGRDTQLLRFGPPLLRDPRLRDRDPTAGYKRAGEPAGPDGVDSRPSKRPCSGPQ
ncbi:hypothetical protein LTR08_007658 [Meristemomyces frigidus]|nr:hypothetical protein LTR08_007658 [Meristemomyces frigidus]